MRSIICKHERAASRGKDGHWAIGNCTFAFILIQTYSTQKMSFGRAGAVRTCEVGPGGGVVLLHKGAGVNEEKVYIAASQAHVEASVTVPAPIPLRQIRVHL